MLKDILMVSGKPGLYKLIKRGNGMLIVESLRTKERLPIYDRERMSSLSNISVFAIGEDIPLSDVLTKIKEKEKGQPISFDIKNAPKDTLYEYFSTVVPQFDKSRVYPTDVQKALRWYNELIESGITDFSSVDEEDRVEEVKSDVVVKSREGDVNERSVVSKSVKSQSGKTQKSRVSSVKTGVGAKKG